MSTPHISLHRRLRLLLAVSIALAAHVTALAMVAPGIAPLSGSEEGGGEAGTALISLQAAPGDIKALVTLWDTPPALEAPDELTMPVAMDWGLADAPRLPETPDDALARTGPAVTLTQIPDPARTARAYRPAADASPSAVFSTQVAPPMPDVPPAAPAQAKPKAKPKAKPTEASQPAAKTETKPAAKSKTKPAPHDVAEPTVKTTTGVATSGQRASGVGSARTAGQGGSAKSSTLSKAQISDLTSDWGAAIRARIEARKRYPAEARGVEGKVTLRLTITREGRLAGVSLTKSSGSAALDVAALRAVKAAGRFTAAPKGLGEASYSFSLPMSFSR